MKKGESWDAVIMRFFVVVFFAVFDEFSMQIMMYLLCSLSNAVYLLREKEGMRGKNINLIFMYDIVCKMLCNVQVINLFYSRSH